MASFRQAEAADPCLCGSGRRLGECCADDYAFTVANWMHARDARRRLADRIVEFAAGRWGVAIYHDARRWFRYRNKHDMRHMWNLFARWFVFTWIPNWDEPELNAVPSSWPTAPLAVAWLETEPDDLNDYDRRFLMTASQSPCSLLLVESIVPGWTVSVQDLFTSRRFRIIDPVVSTRVRHEDVLVGAVLTLNGVSTFLGLAACALSSSYRTEAAEVCDGITGERWFTRTQLLDEEYEAHGLYQDALDGEADKNLRGLESIGVPLDPLVLRWSIAASFNDALEKLRPLTVCFEDDESLSLDHAVDGRPEAVLGWYERGPTGDEDDWHARGWLYLHEGRLAADVATPARADVLIAEVARRLGGAATLIERRPAEDFTARQLSEDRWPQNFP